MQADRRGAGDSRAKIQRFVKATALFDRVSRASRESVIAASTLTVVANGDSVVSQGTVADALVVLGRGRVRIERTTPDKRTVPLGYRGTGDVLGETCLGNSRRHLESAIAMEEVEAVRVPLDTMQELMAADPAMGLTVLALLSSRQRDTEDRIESMLFRNVEGRLAELLLRAADRWGIPNPRGTLISAPITHLEIAQSIGSTRETVTLTLGALRRQGILDVAGRRLIVADRDALARRQ